MSSRIIKIATRASPLAVWQADQAKQLLEGQGRTAEIIKIETSGDNRLDQPAYAFGITGIFTKELDISLLNNKSDIAVHSLKDVPTELAQGLYLAATMKRGSAEDVIILKDKKILDDVTGTAKIATGSFRRSAQWLSRYPNHITVPIRGNVQTRLKKFHDDKTLDGIIFAKAGLERLDILPENAITLNWMLPAAAQGIIGIICRKDDSEMIDICKKINNSESYNEAFIERDFLNSLMGGCSVPIGVRAKSQNGKIDLQGGIYDYDGRQKFCFAQEYVSSDINAGKNAAAKLMENAKAAKLMEKIRNMDMKKQEYDND